MTRSRFCRLEKASMIYLLKDISFGRVSSLVSRMVSSDALFWSDDSDSTKSTSIYQVFISCFSSNVSAYFLRGL